MSQTSRSTEAVRTTERVAFYRREHSSVHPRAAPVRWCVREGLEFLGIRHVPCRNAPRTSIGSRDSDPVTVRVIRTDEDMMVARHTPRLMRLTAKEGA